LRMWDLTDRRHPREAELHRSDAAVSAAQFVDRKTLAIVTTNDRRPRLWDLTDPHQPVLLSQLCCGDRVTEGSASLDQHLRVAVTSGEQRRLWNIADSASIDLGAASVPFVEQAESASATGRRPS